MYSRLRRNSPRAKQIDSSSLNGSFTPPKVFAPGTLFSCVMILVIMAAAFSLRQAHPVQVAAEEMASHPDVLVITASISRCEVFPVHSWMLIPDRSTPGAAKSSVSATLTVDCSYSLVHSSSSSSSYSLVHSSSSSSSYSLVHSSSSSIQSNSVEHTQQQQQQQPPQLLEVAGLDALTCAVHNKLLTTPHQQQRYVFMLHRQGTTAGYHVVEYASLPNRSTDSQALLSRLLSGWEPTWSSQLAWQPLGCYTSTNHTRTEAGSSSSSNAGGSSTASVAPSQPGTTSHTPAGAVNLGRANAAIDSARANAVPAATTPQRRLLQGPDAASPSPEPVDSQPPSPSPVAPPVLSPSPSPSPDGEQSPPPSPVVQSVSSPSPPPFPAPSPEPADNTTSNGAPPVGGNSTAALYSNVTANEGPQEVAGVIVVNVTSGRLVKDVNAPLEVVKMVCSFSTATGPCRASIRRWAYDASRGACRNFTYGGCQGNQNNFESKDLCERVCLPAMANITANVTNTTEPATPSQPPPPFVPVLFRTERLPDLVVTQQGVDYASPPPTSNADAYGVAVSMLTVVFVVLIEFLLVY